MRVHVELAPCDHLCTTCKDPLEGEEDTPCSALHSKGTELTWTTCTMSHYFKEKPHSWHLECMFGSPSLACLIQMTPRLRSTAPAPVVCSPFPSVSSSIPQSSEMQKHLIKREMEALDANGEI